MNEVGGQRGRGPRKAGRGKDEEKKKTRRRRGKKKAKSFVDEGDTVHKRPDGAETKKKKRTRRRKRKKTTKSTVDGVSGNAPELGGASKVTGAPSPPTLLPVTFVNRLPEAREIASMMSMSKLVKAVMVASGHNDERSSVIRIGDFVQTGSRPHRKPLALRAMLAFCGTQAGTRAGTDVRWFWCAPDPATGDLSQAGLAGTEERKF